MEAAENRCTWMISDIHNILIATPSLAKTSTRMLTIGRILDLSISWKPDDSNQI